jgi:hypothetical protein
MFVYYETIKRELNKRLVYECRCNERLKAKVEGSTCLVYTFVSENRVDEVFYYESIKRELQRRLIHEYRCDERLKTKTEQSTRLADTGLVVELEHRSEYCVTKKQKIPVMSRDIFSLLFYWNKIISPVYRIQGSFRQIVRRAERIAWYGKLQRQSPYKSITVGAKRKQR